MDYRIKAAIYTVLFLVTRTSSELKAPVLYKVKVITSDVRGAGTDADVFIKIFGAQANTSAIQLPNSRQPFKRGSTVEFSFLDANVGNSINKVAVKRTGSDSWKLEKLILAKGTPPIVYKFAFNKWISAADKWVYESPGGK